MAEEPKDSLGEKLAKALLEVAAGAATGYLVSEAYTRWMTPRQKRAWESRIKMHHGKAGVQIASGGAAAGSSFVVGVGLGLMAHDRNDYKKWFSSDKQELYPET